MKHNRKMKGEKEIEGDRVSERKKEKLRERKRETDTEEIKSCFFFLFGFLTSSSTTIRGDKEERERE